MRNVYTELDRIFIPLIRQKLGAELSPQIVSSLQEATKQLSALSRLTDQRPDILPANMSQKSFFINILPDVFDRFDIKIEKKIDNKLNDKIGYIADAIIRAKDRLAPLTYQHQERRWESPDFNLRLEACFADVQSAFNMVATEIQIQKGHGLSKKADAKPQLSDAAQTAVGLKDPVVAMLEQKEARKKSAAQTSEYQSHEDPIEDFIPEKFRKKAGETETKEVTAEPATSQSLSASRFRG